MTPIVWSPRPGLDRRRQCTHMHANACICIPNPHTTGGETKPHPAPHPTPNKGGGYKDPTQPPTPHPTAGGDTMARGVGGVGGQAWLIYVHKNTQTIGNSGGQQAPSNVPLSFMDFWPLPPTPSPLPPCCVGSDVHEKQKASPARPEHLFCFPPRRTRGEKNKTKTTQRGERCFEIRCPKSIAKRHGWGGVHIARHGFIRSD